MSTLISAKNKGSVQNPNLAASDLPNELSRRKRRKNNIPHQNRRRQMIGMIQRTSRTARKIQSTHDGRIGKEERFSKS